jgi:hypothetical protein
VADEPSSAVVARTLAFLQEATPRGTLTRQKKPTADQRTQPHVGPEHDTASSPLGRLRRAVGVAGRKPLLLLGVGGGLVALLVVVLALTHREGTPVRVWSAGRTLSAMATAMAPSFRKGGEATTRPPDYRI